MKKAWAMLVAVMLLFNLVGMSVFAASEHNIQFKDSGIRVVNQRGTNMSKYFVTSIGEVTTDNSDRDGNCPFDQTYYFLIDPDQIDHTDASSNYFRVTFSDKKNMNKYLDGNPELTTRSVDGVRYAAIKVKAVESNSTEEEEVRFTINLRARKDGNGFDENDEFIADFRLFFANDDDYSGDADPDAGDHLVFRPVINDDNTITWGTETYPVATLEFDASSDADDFYAKLSTKTNSRIYDRYGDPADAELFFRTFSGDHIDATSRGTLTLYNPWYDDNYRYAPDPRDIYIYRIVGSELEDITNQFTYVDEDDTPEGVDGWETRTRVLDAYVISDKRLDDYYDDDWPPVDGDELPPDNNNGTTARPIKPGYNNVPSTGSYNFVPVALIAAALSAGAFAVTRKRKK